jgi:hypothetical protein
MEGGQASAFTFDPAIAARTVESFYVAARMKSV